jgi:Cys-tRNA(Pro)/Cys-tRNA(Cys) deacylase
MASHKEAERLTGLQVGGISALSLIGRPFDVYLDRSALQHDQIAVSAGRPGVNLGVAPADLLEATGAEVVDAAVGA